MIRRVLNLKGAIIEKLEEGFRKFAIFPYGDVGMQVEELLTKSFGIEPWKIFDNTLCKYNSQIFSTDILKEECLDDTILIFSTDRTRIYYELRALVEPYFKERIIEVGCDKIDVNLTISKTEIGKYSYGPLCRNHEAIKSIGAFCSFADGVEAVWNHESYISTHSMMTPSNFVDEVVLSRKGMPEPDGLNVRDRKNPYKRLTIGNDVWLGKNVIITNHSNIGNGVVAGAGAVITKDIPDYAVVVGTPARIIKYRFPKEQIRMLNEIAWCDWTDEQIIERFDDFYLSGEEFCNKYYRG